MLRRNLSFLSTALLLVSAASLRAAEPPAELVIRGAQIVTMDAALPTATALAVRSGEVVYVGNDAGATAFVGPQTRLIAADATLPMTVLPGLHDAHAHLIGLGQSLTQVDLRSESSVTAILDKLRFALTQLNPDVRGGWLLGQGWDQNRFNPPRLPSLADLAALDTLTGERPIILRRIDGHALWTNSAVLRRAGLSRNSVDPPGGRILRDANGELTGVLLDNAMGAVDRLLPPLSPAELEQTILTASAYVTARGLTAVHEMGIGPDEVAAYRRLANTGRLPLRIFGYHDDPIASSLAQFPGSPAYQNELAGLRQRLGRPEISPMFSMRGIKLYMDGALGSRGAALDAPYSDDPRSNGLLVSTPEHIEAMARWAILHGYQIATHAIGDRANHIVLDAYEKAGATADQHLRFRIEHVQVLRADDLRNRRFLELGVIASIQPSHATSDMPWVGARLGSERLLGAYAWQSLLRSGARICAGSDFPVEEANPRLILHAAVTRTDARGQPPGGFFPEQRLTIGEAIRAMTSDAAYAVFAEDRLGQIMVGRQADLTVLGGTIDLSAGAPPPTDLLSRPGLLTIVAGRVVFDGMGAVKAPAKRDGRASEKNPPQNQWKR